MMYVGNFYFRGQRSYRGHIRFWAKKLQEFLSPELNIVEFFNLNWNNAFLCCTCVFFFIWVKSHQEGQKVKIRFSMGRKKSNISNRKNNSVNMFYMDRDAKVSTVTPSSDLPLRGQRSKKVKFQKYFKSQK